MAGCIESILKGGEDVEILIVNDGSKDDTAKIADEYMAKYPTIIKAIHQENAGHGGAVNAGIANATGLFFKVVDSDDHLEEKAYMEMMESLRGFAKEAEAAALENREADIPDMVVANYVYDKVGEKHKKVMEYSRYFPEKQIFTWEEARKMRTGHYLLMHSIIYRTEVLHEVDLKLPEHTFYVDNIFAFKPFVAVEKLYYVNVNLYMYFIGRDDQSVQEDIMIKRIDQQYKVNNIMIEYMATVGEINPIVRKYMLNYLSIITAITSLLLIKINTKESLERKEALWNHIREVDAASYRAIRKSLLGRLMNRKSHLGRRVVLDGYAIAQKIYGFN